MKITLTELALEINNNWSADYTAVLKKDYLAVKYRGRIFCKILPDMKIPEIPARFDQAQDALEHLTGFTEWPGGSNAV